MERRCILLVEVVIKPCVTAHGHVNLTDCKLLHNFNKNHSAIRKGTSEKRIVMVVTCVYKSGNTLKMEAYNYVNYTSIGVPAVLQLGRTRLQQLREL